MARDTHIYGEVNSKSDMKKIFLAIRREAEEADSRPALTRLSRFAPVFGRRRRVSTWILSAGGGRLAQNRCSEDLACFQT